MTFIVHFQTSQEKRSPKGLLSFHRVADDAVIRVYDEAGNVIETHEHAGDFKNCDAFFLNRYTIPQHCCGSYRVATMARC